MLPAEERVQGVPIGVPGGFDDEVQLLHVERRQQSLEESGPVLSAVAAWQVFLMFALDASLAGDLHKFLFVEGVNFKMRVEDSVENVPVLAS